jgi:hypothetical protein
LPNEIERELAQTVDESATKDYSPELGSVVASAASTEQSVAERTEPQESASSRRDGGWRPIEAITRAARAASMVVRTFPTIRIREVTSNSLALLFN